MAKEVWHDDGSKTVSSESGSITYDPDGHVREQTTYESSSLISLVPILGEMCAKDMAVTKDGDGHVTHVERRNP